jgi:tetratricopeptide (TPR) repeat protein
MNMNILGPRVFALLWLIVVSVGTGAAQDDRRLDDLFHTLLTTEDPGQAQRAESQIWQIWTDSGHEDINALMTRGVDAMNRRQFDRALDTFDEIVRLAPGFAEGWNKRATVYYLRDELTESVEDIRRTLALEPRHFGAISGMGLIFLERGDEAAALQAFESVLEINPHAPGARLRVEYLRARLRGNAI